MGPLAYGNGIGVEKGDIIPCLVPSMKDGTWKRDITMYKGI